MTDEPPFPGRLYELCTDEHCPVRYAYDAERGQPHYHFRGSAHHPAWDVP